MLAMGERVIGPGLAREIAEAWLTSEFEGGRHQNRIGKIADYEVNTVIVGFGKEFERDHAFLPIASFLIERMRFHDK